MRQYELIEEKHIQTDSLPNEHRLEPLDDDRGSIIIGFLLGYLLNIIGIVIVFLLKKPRTTFGLILGLIVWFLMITAASILIVHAMITMYGG